MALTVQTTRGPVVIEDRPITEEAKTWAEVVQDRIRVDELYLVCQAMMDAGAALARDVLPVEISPEDYAAGLATLAASPELIDHFPEDCAECMGRILGKI